MLVNSHLDAKLFTKIVVYSDAWCSISIHCLSKSNFPLLNTQLLHRPQDDFSRHFVKGFFKVYESKMSGLCFPRCFLCICLRVNMPSMVSQSGLKSHYISLILSDDLKMLLITHSTIFMMKSNSFSLQWFPITNGSLFPLKQLIMWDKFQSSGIFPSATILFASFVRCGMMCCCEASIISSCDSRTASSFFFSFHLGNGIADHFFSDEYWSAVYS